MTTTVSGGGGGGYPGVTSDGFNGLHIKGGLTLNNTGSEADPYVFAVGDGHTDLALRVQLAGGAVAITAGGSTIAGTFLVNSPGTSDFLPILQVLSDLGQLLNMTEGGIITLLKGIGLYGFTPTRTTPRTLPQATITAITDANAKAAIQAVANDLADIGALTLT